MRGPAGSSSRAPSILSLTSLATATAFASGSWKMAMPAAGLAVEIERLAVGLRAELDVADVADPGDAARQCRARP